MALENYEPGDPPLTNEGLPSLKSHEKALAQDYVDLTSLDLKSHDNASEHAIIIGVVDKTARKDTAIESPPKKIQEACR